MRFSGKTGRLGVSGGQNDLEYLGRYSIFPVKVSSVGQLDSSEDRTGGTGRVEPGAFPLVRSASPMVSIVRHCLGPNHITACLYLFPRSVPWTILVLCIAFHVVGFAAYFVFFYGDWLIYLFIYLFIRHYFCLPSQEPDS